VLSPRARRAQFNNYQSTPAALRGPAFCRMIIAVVVVLAMATHALLNDS
jgi:hypothetical protein